MRESIAVRPVYKTSYKISLSGVITSLCLLLMFLTGVFTPLGMALPLYAGLLVYVVLDELGVKWAVLTYAAVSILSFFITPNKDSSVYFAVFFGSYPILKFIFEGIHGKIFQIAAKILAFNIIIITAVTVTIYIFDINNLFEDFDFLGNYVIPILWIIANIFFLLYDYTLGAILESYLKWFKPTFLKNK
ncbi:MAG: hypothetical protein LBM41_06555 [Ruminococcus sp.]|nr:hypothetical protein [Ruminococcus sp.]